MARAQKSITRGVVTPLRQHPKARRRGPRPPVPPLPRYLTQEELARFRRAVVTNGELRRGALWPHVPLRSAGGGGHAAPGRGSRSRPRARAHSAREGRDTKEYPLPRELTPLIRRYLRQRTGRGPYLFTGRQSSNQRGLTVLRIQQLFKAYAETAGLPPSVASHSLRHSIAVHSLEEGFGLEYVADLLGHTTIRSTAIYAKVTTPARDAMIRRLDKSRYVVSWS